MLMLSKSARDIVKNKQSPVRNREGRYSRCVKTLKHPMQLLIERFAKLLDQTYTKRLRKVGLTVNQKHSKVAKVG